MNGLYCMDGLEFLTCTYAHMQPNFVTFVEERERREVDRADYRKSVV